MRFRSRYWLVKRGVKVIIKMLQQPFLQDKSSVIYTHAYIIDNQQKNTLFVSELAIAVSIKKINNQPKHQPS